jgi:SecD/SecF fusion protein
VAADFVVVEEPASRQERFDGSILAEVSVGRDESQLGIPVTKFKVKTEWQNVFEQWTTRNVQLPMAIILNEEYHSAPYIQSPLKDDVQVTLGTRDHEAALEQAKELMTTLQTGSLRLRPVLESKQEIGAKLAGESRDRGVLATGVAFLLVLGFMLFYYRGAGMVANLALVLNIVLLVGALAAFQAVLTLPGIAGIVLTLGMAVDANILINERIREERLAGRSMHRALSEGYDRALVTIVDANMTTVITAVFLYVYGSGPIRGFAVSLILGLLISMFTAVYVTRTVFEWLIKKGWLKEIRVTGSGIVPKFPWMSWTRVLVPISVAAVVLGLLAFFTADRYDLYDIDFTGGHKLQAQFAERATVDDLKDRLRRPPVVVTVTRDTFDEQGNPSTETRKVTAGPYPDADVLSVGTEGRRFEIKIQRGLATGDLTTAEQGQAVLGYLQEALKDRLVPEWIEATPAPYAHKTQEGAPPDDVLAKLDGGVHFTLAFADPAGLLTPEAVRRLLVEEFPYSVKVGSKREIYPASSVDRTVEVRKAASTVAGVQRFEVWMKSATKRESTQVEANGSDLRIYLGEFLGGPAFKPALAKVLAKPAAEVDSVVQSRPFPSQDQIGASVANRLKNDAILALFLSFVGIIVYMAFRFSSRTMGLAAVLCLFHDVIVTLGVLALASSLGLVDGKINLTMVAAFLTLVGYSVNDTVVTFDRIRENRGKRPTVDAPMIDLSVNQTLGRTLKTVTTVLLVCLALFVINMGQRNVLEGFAFVLIIGSFVGTYSTVAISAPLLLFLPWAWERVKVARPRTDFVRSCAANPWLALLLPVAAFLWLVWAAAFSLYAFAVGLVLFTPWAMRGQTRAEARIS